ncbi:MAG: hypothetical protein Q9M08_07025 [Mariprofundus sp.]|nr:hypothetical protein [Mariprofundus sp.]
MFPSAARWYLAAIAVLSLLCIAMQLSIQAYAQKQAKELIRVWSERANVHIDDVRYHLLRNGLVLQGLRIERGSDKVSIKHIFVRANPKLLTSSTPRIGIMDISGFDAEFTSAVNSKIWHQDRDLKQIWQAATSLTVHGGHVNLYLKGKDFPPVELRGLSLHQQLQTSGRTITGSAKLLQGTLNGQWNMATETQKGESSQSKGIIKWHALDASQLTASLALKHIEGHLNGELSWKMAAGDAEKKSLNLQGEIQLDTVSDRETSNPHSLQFNATNTDDLWKIDIAAAAWPLDPWSDTLPMIGGRQLISAQLDSTSHWRGRDGHWKISSDKGLLQDMIYARPDRNQEGNKHSAWYWSRISYAKANIDTDKNRLHLSAINMVDSRLMLQAGKADTIIQADTGDAADKNSPPGLPEKTLAWNIYADHINIRNMMLALTMPQGKVTLEALDGKAQCPKGKPLSFKLHTAAVETSLAPDKNSATSPKWRLRGSAEKDKHGELISASFNVTGTHIPIARLRPLLPLQDDISSPVKLAGDTEFKAKVTVKQGSWQMQGKAAVRDFNLSHGGNSWLAKQVNLQFGPVGMGLDAQKINSIKSQEWQYTAALHPLPPRMPDSTQPETTEVSNPLWWVTTLRKNNTKIGHLVFENGKISIGQQQSIWADQVDFKADTIKIDHWSDISIKGKAGSGDFHFNGKWQALSDEQRFQGKAVLSQATPFFLHNWMTASGMPHLIQGRLSAKLSVNDGHAPDSYQSTVKVQLIQGRTEAETFPSDPMLARTGYNTSDLLQRLDQHTGVITLQYDLAGQWTTQPLNLERLGLSMQAAMHQAVQSVTIAKDKPKPAKTVTEARIRLHDRERLSQNERIRLFSVVRKMRQAPDTIVELRARWSGKKEDSETDAEIQRIRRTQQLIERYMIYRKINSRRIFPVWPTAEDQTDETGSIQVVTKKLPSQKAQVRKPGH